MGKTRFLYTWFSSKLENQFSFKMIIYNFKNLHIIWFIVFFFFFFRSSNDYSCLYLNCLHAGKVTMPDGSNVRKAVLSVITELQAKLLASAEDDTKSLNIIVNVSKQLLDWKCQVYTKFIQRHFLLLSIILSIGWR